MASRFGRWCANLPGLFLWMMLIIQEIGCAPQGWHENYPPQRETRFNNGRYSWPMYNAGVPRYPNYFPFPYNYIPVARYFGNARSQNITNFPRNPYGQWIFVQPSGWTNNGPLRAPGSSRKPSSTKTQAHRARGQETTTTTTTTTASPRKTVPDQDEITRLIEEALRNGELLYMDDWIKWRSMRARQKWSRPRPNQEERGSTAAGHDGKHEEELGRPVTAPVCGGSTFCESLNVTDYPERLVNLAIQRNDSLTLLAKDDTVLEIDERFFDEDLDATPLCRARTRTVYPRSAESVDRGWLFVVNQKNFKQGVRVEVCIREGSDCGGLGELIPEGYSITCKQSYIHRELAAISPDGTIEMSTFRFPASCCCNRVMKDVYGNFLSTR